MHIHDTPIMHNILKQLYSLPFYQHFSTRTRRLNNVKITPVRGFNRNLALVQKKKICSIKGTSGRENYTVNDTITGQQNASMVFTSSLWKFILNHLFTFNKIHMLYNLSMKLIQFFISHNLSFCCFVVVEVVVYITIELYCENAFVRWYGNNTTTKKKRLTC